MEQPELGKNEDEQEVTSSAELSESQTAAAPESPAESAEEVTGAEDTSSEVEQAELMPAEAATEESADDEDDDDVVTAEETADDDDDEDDEGAEEANGLRRGMVIQGVITRTTPNEIFVDLGEGREGIVPKREVELMSGKLLEAMQEGADLHVYVVNPNNHRGQIILSVNHAQEELDWRKAEEYMESKAVYDGKIGGYNKGGLIVRFGRLRGFVPQSQISDKRQLDISGDTPEERYSGLVNQQISVKVMEVDRSRNRLILSERAAMREVRQRRKEALITELEVGEIRDGRVVSLENFGAFVDIGGAEGLVHITELAWQHVTHPRQILDVGQDVEVKVINVDENKNRIGLSIKQLQPDPWDELAAEYNTGSLVKGTVTKLTKFGAFAQIDTKQAVEGLIHISELADERVDHPRDVVQKGDKLTLRVVKVDVKNRRLGLSLRRVNSAEYLDEDLKRAYIEEKRYEERLEASPDAETEPAVEPAAAAVEANTENEVAADTADTDWRAKTENEAADDTETTEIEDGAEPEAANNAQPEGTDTETVVDEERETSEK